MSDVRRIRAGLRRGGGLVLRRLTDRPVGHSEPKCGEVLSVSVCLEAAGVWTSCSSGRSAGNCWNLRHRQRESHYTVCV